MAEKVAHRRAKIKAAGALGKTEAPLPGNQRLDALTSGGGRRYGGGTQWYACRAQGGSAALEE